jgi:uncharacterized protein (TIGR02171 family)
METTQLVRIAPSVLMLCMLSCSPDHTTSSQPKAFSTLATARLVPAKGIVFRLGSDDPQASPEEAPGWTRFGHDFWLDTTDITQQEFQSLTGRTPSPATASGAAKPVVNVTWFDAILFCNARSKRDHLDTVYDYVGLSGDSTGSVWDVQGLTTHLERSGWHLPTEAEWEYAARAGTTTPYSWGTLADSSKAALHAWYQANSNASLHGSALLAPNGWGFYDLAGDAMEWVQDWKGSFPKDTVTDFAGPDSPGDVPEAPLKGGAYNYGLEHLRPSSRTATYAAYRSSRAEYVGFRCARGGFTATYTNSAGQSVQAPPVSVVRSDVAKLLGVQSARLVFVNRSNNSGTLSWIDYGEATPVVRSLPDVDPVFHPVISPDGNWVAWCTVMEGSTGTSRIKARRLAVGDTTVLDLGAGAIPRWWTDGTDTFLVWGTSAEDNTASGWGSGQTKAQQWSDGGLTGSVQTWAPGSYHDGRSGQYLYGGYRRLKQYNLGSQSSKILFTAPQDGKAAGDTSQACNASAAPDGSGRSLFLDFGYSGVSSVVGRPYGIHEIAFEADSLGNVIQTFPVASGKLEWDHLRWSNNGQWAAGVAVEQNGAYKEIHLLDLSTGNTFPILSGQELWMPGLWVGEARVPVVAGTVDLDSAGSWDTPATDANQDTYAAKMQKFWPLRDQVRIAAVGSSRVMAGIVAEGFSVPAYNWGISGSDVIGDRVVILDYLIPQASQVQAVVLSLMPGWMFSSRGEEVWNNAFATMGYQYDRNHAYWQSGVPAAYLQVVATRSNAWTSQFDSAGTYSLSGNGWGGANPPCLPPATEDFDGMIFQSNWADLTAIADACRNRGIQLVVVNFPQSPYYAQTSCMGKYGPSWATWDELRARILSLQASNPMFHFYDANQDGKHDYADSAAWNFDHLSTAGARILTSRLDSLIRTLPLRQVPSS